MFLDRDERLMPLVIPFNPLTLDSLKSFKEVGLKTVRLNSWAYWDEMEPEPGVYVWDKPIEDNVELALQANLKAVVHLYRRAPDWLPEEGKKDIVYDAGSWEIGGRDGARPGKTWLSVNPFHKETLELELGFLEAACEHFSIPGEVQCTYSLPYGSERILPFRLGLYTKQMCIDIVLARQEVFAKYSSGLWSAFHPTCGMPENTINASIDPHIGNEHATAVYAAMVEHFPKHIINRILYGFFALPGSWSRSPLPKVKTWVGAEFASGVVENAKKLNGVRMWGMVMACQPGQDSRHGQPTPKEFANIEEAIEILNDGLDEAEENYMEG